MLRLRRSVRSDVVNPFIFLFPFSFPFVNFCLLLYLLFDTVYVKEECWSLSHGTLFFGHVSDALV